MIPVKFKDNNGNWVKLPLFGIEQFPEAPADDKIYGRKNRNWESIKIPTKTSQITNDSNYVVDPNYVHINEFTHPICTPKSTGLYNIDVDQNGHVIKTSNVTKEDITSLGIPSQDTTYDIATSEKDGLMSKDDKAKLDQMKGGDVEVSKANVEKVLTGNILTHTHDTERIVTGMPTDVWDGVTVSTALAGSGTVDDPYLIQSCADYIHFYRNPSLYSYPFGEPTPEMLANPKQIKITTNLNFNHILLDFEVPDVKNDIPNELLFLCHIDGQGCVMSNLNYVNTWSVLPYAGYCIINNIHIINGVFTIPLDVINTKGYFDSVDGLCSPWGIVSIINIVMNTSFVAELKFSGDIEMQFNFNPGSCISRNVMDTLGIEIKEGYFFSDVKYSLVEDFTNIFVLCEVPASIEITPNSIVGYDLTTTTIKDGEEPVPGINVGMVMDFVGEEPYTFYINSERTVPIYMFTPPFHTAKTTAEMKSPDFLSQLNGDTETFVADTENVNDGYPIFKPNTIEQKIDGYVRESAFEAFKNNMPTGGSGNVYNLDIDISGEISKLDSNMQTLGWGRTYTAPTSDNIVELLGGNDGIRDLCKKLAPSNNPIVTAPFLAYILPSTLISSTVILSIMDSNMNTMLPLSDGCLVMISMQFYLYMSNAIYSIACGINISNFNLSTQSATYSYSMDEINTSSGQSTEVLDYLTSTNTAAALSANQGRVLKGMIDNISSTTVVNSLTSTSTTNALSAAKGKELKTLVDGKVASTEITTIKKLTQSAYDALSSKDSKTLYIIVG